MDNTRVSTNVRPLRGKVPDGDLVLPPVMTTKEAAAYLRLSTKTLLRMASAGEIPGAEVGGQWRFKRADLEQMLEPKAAST